jgi:hypothetical protein
MLAQPVEKCQPSTQTPSSNTGLNRHPLHESGITHRLDYLVLCGYGYLEDVVAALWSAWGTNFNFQDARPGHRGKRYDTIAMSSQGIELAYGDACTISGERDIRVSIPGEPLSHIDQSRLWNFAKWANYRQYHASRIDYCIDDFSRTLTVDDVAIACENGDYAGAAEHRYYRRKKRGDYVAGQTVYLGSAQSDKQVRIYDKNIQSGGTVASTRVETQWRRHLARFAFDAYVTAEDCLSANQRLAQCVLGSLDFVRRTSSVLGRCQQIGWWTDFCSRVGAVQKLARSSIQPLISRKIAWVESQVSGTLALIAQCKSLQWVEHWLHRIVQKRLSEPNPARAAFAATWRDRQFVEKMSFERCYTGSQLDLFPHRYPQEKINTWLAPSPIAHIPLIQALPTPFESMNRTVMLPFPEERAYSCQLELPICLVSQKGLNSDTPWGAQLPTL